MSVNEINNYSNNLQAIISKKSSTNQLESKKIQDILKDAHRSIVHYYASKPANLKELECLIHFENEIKEIDQKIIGKAGKKLVKTINRISDEAESKKAFFFHKGSLKIKVGLILEKLKDTFAGKIRNKIRQDIFYTWNQKKRYLNSLKKVATLTEKIKQLETEISKNPQKIKTELEKTKIDLEKTSKFINEYEKNLKVGENTRKQLTSIGGVHVVIETQDHETLDAFYLSANSFYDKCMEAKAEKILIKSPKQNIQGLLLSSSEKSDQFLQTLEGLKLFAHSSGSESKGSGWAKVCFGDKIVILPEIEIKTLQDSKLLEEKDGHYILSELSEITKSTLSYNPELSGTIILGMGAAGVYEMYKRETLALLMQGVNVMLYNQRGSGESSGAPSETGTYEDIEAVYQYLKQTHHQDDKKLVVKGLCLSGGIAANLAARHPDINIILDQTYSEISDIALNTVLESIKDIISYNPEDKNKAKEAVITGLTPILKILVNLITPNYSINRHLNKVRGKILILRATEDTYTPAAMTNKIIDSYVKESKYESKPLQIRIGHMPGIHGSSWLDAKTEEEGELGKFHLYSFLNEAKILNPYLDGGSTLRTLSKEHNDYLEKLLAFIIADDSEAKKKPPKSLLFSAYSELKKIIKNSIVIIPPLENVIDGKMHYQNVLSELNRLKAQLGETPKLNKPEPKLEESINRIIIFGLSKTVIQQRFGQILKENWQPLFFWESLAKLFGVRKDNLLSHYEEAHLSIQRFGMLTANKDRILENLKFKRKDNYKEFTGISSLHWHPEQNGYAVEKIYIEFLDYVFTDYFKELQKQSDDLLIEFFKIFDGVCFENRVRKIEEFVQKHPMSSSFIEATSSVSDWDTSQPVERAFEKESIAFALKEGIIEQENFLNHLKDKGIFEMEFMKDGKRTKPTELDFHIWAIRMVDALVIEPYSLDKFIDIQLKIFKESGRGVTLEDFKNYLNQLKGQNDGFDPTSKDTEAYLNVIKTQLAS